MTTGAEAGDEAVRKEDERRERNQRNALKSTGPQSAEGKARASRNALRHGLAGVATVVIPKATAPFEMPDDDEAAYTRFLAGEREAHRHLETLSQLLAPPQPAGLGPEGPETADCETTALAFAQASEAISRTLASLERLQRYRNPALIRWLKHCEER